MTTEEVIAALQRMKVQTGSLVCLGCGREHNCGIHGCAILLAAKQELERQAEKIKELEAKIPRWIPCSERMPEAAKEENDG